MWSHTQGPFPLRGDLAKALKIAPEAIRVIHAQGAGCYGHNGADDVALDAALLARAVPGRPVRVHWAHEEEMAWEPWGSAMVTRLTGGVAADGALTQWTHDVWSFPHSTRPGSGAGCNLRSAWYLADPVLPAKAVDGPLPNGAAARNAVPIYAAANQTVTSHYLAAMPIRTSALRTLGGYFNAVSAEMFVDELAAMSGRDPVAFRLANVRDPRLVAVLKKARRDVRLDAGRRRPPAAGAGDGRHRRRPLPLQEPGCLCGGGRRGLGRHQQRQGPAAPDVERHRRRPRRQSRRRAQPDRRRHGSSGELDPAGGRPLGRGIMTAVDYGAYPIQDFVTTPAMASVVIDRPDQPSLGAGEGSQGPAGAAIANAVFAATGRRVAEVPLTPERVLAALRA